MDALSSIIWQISRVQHRSKAIVPRSATNTAVAIIQNSKPSLLDVLEHCDINQPICYEIPLLRGWSVAGLPLICIKGGAPGYKVMGRSRIHDSIFYNQYNQFYRHVHVLCLFNLTQSHTRAEVAASNLIPGQAQ